MCVCVCGSVKAFVARSRGGRWRIFVLVDVEAFIAPPPDVEENECVCRNGGVRASHHVGGEDTCAWVHVESIRDSPSGGGLKRTHMLLCKRKQVFGSSSGRGIGRMSVHGRGKSFLSSPRVRGKVTYFCQ